LRFAAKEVCTGLDAGLLRASLLELGFDMDKPSPSYSAETGWLVLRCLARLHAPHAEEAVAQKELGRRLAWALKERKLVTPSHLSLAKSLPGPLRMFSLQKLARGTPFAYAYTRESAGLWRLNFEEGILLPFSLGIWEVLSEWLGKRWVVSAGPKPGAILFVQEG
jgi:hypothetical protein